MSLCSDLVLAGSSGRSVRHKEEAAEGFRQQRGPQEWVRTEAERHREPRQGPPPAMGFRVSQLMGDHLGPLRPEGTSYPAQVPHLHVDALVIVLSGRKILCTVLFVGGLRHSMCHSMYLPHRAVERTK